MAGRCTFETLAITLRPALFPDQTPTRPDTRKAAEPAGWAWKSPSRLNVW
jgi:hypothetical protein